MSASFTMPADCHAFKIKHNRAERDGTVVTFGDGDKLILHHLYRDDLSLDNFTVTFDDH